MQSKSAPEDGRIFRPETCRAELKRLIKEKLLHFVGYLLLYQGLMLCNNRVQFYLAVSFLLLVTTNWSDTIRIYCAVKGMTPATKVEN